VQADLPRTPSRTQRKSSGLHGVREAVDTMEQRKEQTKVPETEYANFSGIGSCHLL